MRGVFIQRKVFTFCWRHFASCTVQSQTFDYAFWDLWRYIKEGEGLYLTKLKSLADGYPVEFSPPTFIKQELAQAYQEAHVFCYPSLAEKGGELRFGTTRSNGNRPSSSCFKSCVL